MAVSAALAALALATPAAATYEAALTLDVTFFANQTIAVTLPDGTPVGTTTGAPTQIPAGYYTVSYVGPMGLAAGLPYFHLGGPGVDLLQNLNEGGTETATDRAVFQPNATYTWTDDAQPGIVHTFATTGTILGTAGAAPSSPVKGAPAASQDVVGSDVVSVRGTLGAGSLAGKRVVVLQAGRYRIKGIQVRKAGRLVHPAAGILTLTAGRWTLSAGGRTVAAVVRQSTSSGSR